MLFTRRFAISTLTSAISAVIASGAYAQQESTEDNVGLSLEEIFVSAQKREENLQEVPISVATLAGEQFDSIFSGGEDIRGLSTKVPGLYAESSNGRAAPRFYIRGLGNVDFDLAASQPVSIIFDEVVQENVVLKSFPLFDVEQVEVIRGPQGSLFGRNTTAGIIKFDSRKPTQETEAYVRAAYGTYNTINVEGAVGGALATDVLSGRLSVLSQNRDDWIDNRFFEDSDAFGGHKEVAARGQLLFTPNDVFSALFNYHVRDLDGTASIFRANVFTTGSNSLNSNYDRDSVSFNQGDNNTQEYESSGTSLKLDWELESVTITSITGLEESDGFSVGDIDGGVAGEGPGFIPFDAVTQDEADVEQFTQEFRIASNDEDTRFNWQVGAFFFDSTLDVTTIDGFFGTTSVTHDNTAWAFFGQASYDATERLTLTGGMRYTDDEKDLVVGQQNVDSFALSIGAASIQDYDPVNVSDDQISWDLSAYYRVGETTSLYGRVASGFRAQSIQARDVAFEGNPSVADSETITSFEVGIKSDTLSDQLRFNAAVFYYEIDDMQLSAIGGANNGNSLLNADTGLGQGFEVDIEYVPSENLRITAGFSYNDTEINDNDLLTAPCGSGQCTVQDQIITVSDPDPRELALIDGNPFQSAPETIFNFTLRYQVPVGSNSRLFAYTDWAVQGETSMALYEAVEFKTDDQYEGGLRLGYENVAHNYQIALFGRNITDEDNVKGFIDFNNNTGFVNEPRIIGVEFTMNI